MVELAIAKYHAENVAHMTSIESRIIGIDGNGTGRKGAIQRLEDSMQQGFSEVNGKVETISKNMSNLTASSYRMENVPKKRIWNTVMVILGAIGVAGMSYIGGLALEWTKHLRGW